MQHFLVCAKFSSQPLPGLKFLPDLTRPDDDPHTPVPNLSQSTL